MGGNVMVYLAMIGLAFVRSPFLELLVTLVVPLLQSSWLVPYALEAQCQCDH